MESSPHPADSLWSWLVLLCAFLTHVFIHGSLASFGILYPVLLAEFGQDKATTGLKSSYRTFILLHQSNILLYGIIFLSCNYIVNNLEE